MYGLQIAFKDFNPALGFAKSPWVGLSWFRTLFTLPNFTSVITNTLVIAVGKIILGQITPIVFALLLNEVKNIAFKKTVQTFVYLPHFLSWVIVGGIFLDMLSDSGLVNKGIALFGMQPIPFLVSNNWFQFTLISTDVWKGFGWGAILYLAALTNISPDLYEAAVIDGANRFQRLIHITLPGITSTIVLLASLSLGGILNAGFDQVLILYNPAVYETGDVLDTFIFRAGLNDMQFSMATAVGLMKSIIGFGLILLSNRMAYQFANYRIF
jgi:putative aldouronate transport system permease protein